MSRGYTLAAPKVADADVLQLIRSLRPRRTGSPLIRIGGVADGGYLLPDDLEGIEYCFSPGVSDSAAFENELADRKIHSFLADRSVAGPPITRPEFTFDRKFVGAVNNDMYMTLEAWKDKYLSGYRGDLLLQMDIEGAEYEVILSTPLSLLMSFRILIVELHWLERLFDPFAFGIVKACCEKLLSRFYVVHAHPNNCSGLVQHNGIEIPDVMEVTFYSRARGAPGDYCTTYPHPLDVDNCRERAPMTLPDCWWSEPLVAARRSD